MPDRQAMEALYYVLRTGCQWKALPRSLGAASTDFGELRRSVSSDEPQLRPLLTENGQYPWRRTWERRLAALPQRLVAQIGCWGRYLVAWIRPREHTGRAAAIDSSVLRAREGVWHKKTGKLIFRCCGTCPLAVW